MIDSLYAGAYWSARKESVEDCKARLANFLSELKSLDPMFGTWFEKGRSRKDALRVPIDITPEVLEEKLLAGRNRTDVAPRRVIEQLGFSFSPWNGQESTVGLSVHCGAYGTARNHVVVDLPDWDQLGHIVNAEFATHLVEAMVECWDPEWATIASRNLREAEGQQVGSVVVGFATYVRSNRRVGPLVLPKGVARRNFWEGQLLTVGTDPMRVDHAAAIKVAAHLKKSNPT